MVECKSIEVMNIPKMQTRQELKFYNRVQSRKQIAIPERIHCVSMSSRLATISQFVLSDCPSLSSNTNPNLGPRSQSTWPKFGGAESDGILQTSLKYRREKMLQFTRCLQAFPCRSQPHPRNSETNRIPRLHQRRAASEVIDIHSVWFLARKNNKLMKARNTLRIRIVQDTTASHLTRM
jgi:hypothetical protein